jgi:hypothetical protein
VVSLRGTGAPRIVAKNLRGSLWIPWSQRNPLSGDWLADFTTFDIKPGGVVSSAYVSLTHLTESPPVTKQFLGLDPKKMPIGSGFGLGGKDRFLFAVISTDKRSSEIYLWRTEIVEDRAWPVHLKGGWPVEISSDGRWLIAAYGGRLRLYPLDIDVVLKRVTDLTGRDLTPEDREQFQLTR